MLDSILDLIFCTLILIVKNKTKNVMEEKENDRNEWSRFKCGKLHFKAKP